MNDNSGKPQYVGEHLQVETRKGVTVKQYRINLPVIGWTEWKVYTPDAYLDDCAWLAARNVNYTVVFKD